MGTNYYLKRIPTEEDVNKMQTLLKEGEYADLEKTLAEEINKEIHICKCSCGWQTCFDHNWGDYWKPDRKSLEEWLSKPNYYIEDEYGEKITAEDFWKMVDERNANPKNHFTSLTYREWEIEHNGYISPLCIEGIKKCKKLFKVKPEDNDFSVDGLRFAVFSDFS